MTPSAAVDGLIPFIQVTDVVRSIAYYELLGLEVTDTHEHECELDWASLENGDARLMLARAGGPIDASVQAVLFYLYVADLDAFRERLLAAGVAAGEIRDGTPGPERELGLRDPDGWCLMVAERE